MRFSRPAGHVAIPRAVLACTALLAASTAIAQPGAAQPAAGDTPKFRTVVSEAGRYAIDVPGPRVDVSEEGAVKFAVPIVAEQANLSLAYLDLPDDINVQGRDPAELLRLFRNGSREGAEFSGERTVTLGDRPIPGLVYFAVMPDGTRVRERLYLDGRRIYMLYAAGAPNSNFLNSPTANRFFDSFRIAEEVGDLAAASN